MTSKIFRSTFFTSIVVVLCCLVMITGVLFESFENQIKNELESEANYIAYAVENEGGGYIKKVSDSADKRITLISHDGTVVADTKADIASLGNHSDREEFRKALENGTGLCVRYSDTLTKKTVNYAKKLSDGSVLRVSEERNTIFSIIIGLIQPLVFILIIASILSFVLSSRVSKSVIKPINSIDLDNPENSNTYEELSPLLRKIMNQRKTIDRQLEKASRMQKEFKLITENMSEGFLVIDKNARLLSYNGAVTKLFNVKNADGNVFALNRTQTFIETVNTVLSGKRTENMMQNEDKTYNLIANPVFKDEKTIGAVIVILDVTESVKRETIRREFTANVSHELKIPLTSISGFAELMKSGTLPAETVADFSNTIYTEAQRLISLVNDIIKISELDERDSHFVFETVNLYSLSEEIIQRLKPEAGKKNVSLNLAGAKADIYGVRQILDEMIYNLCENAIKYNKENGRVDIVISEDTSDVKISVRDTGIGIPKADQNRVFERFYRVDKSRSKSSVGGTGLGLSIVKHAAMYHNAEISLESEIDVGTTITVTFKK